MILNSNGWCWLNSGRERLAIVRQPGINDSNIYISMLIRLWINTKYHQNSLSKRTSQQRWLRSSHVPSRCLDLIHGGIQHQPSNNPCDISQPTIKGRSAKKTHQWMVFQTSMVWSHSSVIRRCGPQPPQGGTRRPAAGAKGTSRTSKTTCPYLRWSASGCMEAPPQGWGVAPVAPVVLSPKCSWGTPKLQKLIGMIMDFG